MTDREKLIEKVKRRLEDPLCDAISFQVSELEETETEIKFFPTDTILDELTGNGLSEDSLTILVGGTGDGKSLLLTHLASKMSENNKILYVSFENTMKVDNSRFTRCKEIYKSKHENIHYINILENEMADKLAWRNEYLKNLILEDNYDLVFIDAIQTSIDAVNIDEIHQVGNVLMKELYKLVLFTHIPMILTWQASRNSAVKKMDAISYDDISGSIGTMRYCTNAFFIKRDGGSRKLKLIKCRESENARWNDPVVDLEMSLRFSVEKFFI